MFTELYILFEICLVFPLHSFCPLSLRRYRHLVLDRLRRNLVVAILNRVGLSRDTVSVSRQVFRCLGLGPHCLVSVSRSFLDFLETVSTRKSRLFGNCLQAKVLLSCRSGLHSSRTNSILFGTLYSIAL